MKFCKDGRIWGQNNKEAGHHLGITQRIRYQRKFTNRELKEYRKNIGKRLGRGTIFGEIGKVVGFDTRFKKGHLPYNPKGQPRPEVSGENNGNWKGGCSRERPYYNSIKYKNWRRKVFERDKFTCQKCNIKNHQGLGTSVKLEAHHIKSWEEFPELRFNVNNGLTLCVPCHGKTRKRKKVCYVAECG